MNKDKYLYGLNNMELCEIVSFRFISSLGLNWADGLPSLQFNLRPPTPEFSRL